MEEHTERIEEAIAEQRIHRPPMWSYALLLLVILFFGLIRIRLLNIPLERDEGEYAYAGQLILHGVAPYQLCYTLKFPGTAAAYAVIEAILGRTPADIHWGLLIVNSGAIILVYCLARRLFGWRAGLVASAVFAALSISPAVFGFAAQATQFVVLFTLAGIVLLLKAVESQKLLLFFWSGLLLGLALLMKQPGVFFILFCICYAVQSQWKRSLNWRRLAAQTGTLFLGAVLPLVFTCLILWRAGVFQKFWFWTFSYARQYGMAVSLSDGIHLLMASASAIVGASLLIWLIAAAGLVLAFWDREARRHVAFVIGLLFFSFAATSTGLYFRGHYFVLVLPAVSLLCATAVTAGRNLLRSSASAQKWAAFPVAICVFAVLFSVVHQRNFLFDADPLTASRELYRGNPFAEAVKISDFLRSHSVPGDRLAVLGSEPEIYFYSGLPSATGYIYMYPLMEPQPFASAMQKEMISEIQAAHPRFLVLVDTPVSWLGQPNSDITIFRWAQAYIESGYRLVGIADMIEGGTEYHWTDAVTYRPRSPYRVLIFDRSPPA